MLRTFFAVCLFLILVPFARADSDGFYMSLLQGIDSASGQAVLWIRDGTWGTTIQVPGYGAPRFVAITVDPNTRALLDFSYRGGAVSDGASMVFTPPIHVAVDGPGPGMSVSISKITFDSTGTPYLTKSTVDNTKFKANPAATAALMRAFMLALTPDKSLSGRPFGNLETLKECQAPVQSHCSQTVGTFVTEVELVTQNGNPGLAVVLRDGATLKFNSRNLLRFVGPTNLSLMSGTYYPDTGQMTATVNKISGTLTSPTRMETDGFALSVANSTSFALQSVTVTKDSNGDTVDASGGAFDLDVGNASYVRLANGNSFYLDTGTSAHLIGFSAQFGAGEATTISIGAGSQMNIILRDGQFSFGDRGYVQIAQGKVNANFDGDTWTSGAANPTATATLSNVSIQIAAGAFHPNVATTVGILRTSRLSATQLNISSTSKSIVGSLTDFAVLVAPNSTVGLPAGFTLTTNSGATVAMNSNDPIVFSADGSYSGTVDIAAQYSLFKDQPNPTFALTNGIANFSLVRKSDGSDHALIKNITGTTVIQSGSDTLKLGFNIHDADLNSNPYGGGGRVNITFKSGNELDFTTDAYFHPPQHDDMAIYPIKVAVIFPADVPTGDMAISFGKRISLNNGSALQFPLKFNLSIPPGLGEHEDRFNANSADGQHGPSEDQNLQEVVQDKVATSTVHVYLIAATYNATAAATIQTPQADMDPRKLVITVNNVTVSGNIGFHTDGGDLLGPILTAVTSAFGFLIGGPIFAIPGAVVGHQLSNDIYGRVDALVESNLQTRLANVYKTWELK